MGAIRQMRYCTGNVSITPNSYYSNTNANNNNEIYPANSVSVDIDESLLMPALDQNKVMIISYANQPLSDGPFYNTGDSQAKLNTVSKIDNGIKLTFTSNCYYGRIVNSNQNQPTNYYAKYYWSSTSSYYYSYISHTFTYRFYIIEFY